MAMEMSGKVARLSERGYGFISGDDGSEVFFHAKQVRGAGFEALEVGDAVTFDVDPHHPRGPRAVNVARVGDVELAQP